MLFGDSVSSDNPFSKFWEGAWLGAARHSLSTWVFVPVLLKCTVLPEGTRQGPADTGVK